MQSEKLLAAFCKAVPLQASIRMSLRSHKLLFSKAGSSPHKKTAAPLLA